ncbi:MAG: MoaD/ThiS family protein [Elusimicrobiaceae bacterium]|nr:MoaD/ThiS family protein [Elusimicrobiaceae bacterium]
MASIILQFQGTIRLKAGTDSISVSGGTVKAALQDAAARLPAEFAEELYRNGKIKTHFIFIHNGEMLNASAIGKRRISDGDIVRLFAPVGGG